MKKLKKILTNMYSSGTEDNYLIISQDPYYVQINGAKKAPQIFIDAVSNEHLDEADFLSTEQNAKFLELGFEIEERSQNYIKELPFSLDEIANISDFILKTLDIYGIDPYKAEFEEEID